MKTKSNSEEIKEFFELFGKSVQYEYSQCQSIEDLSLKRAHIDKVFNKVCKAIFKGNKLEIRFENMNNGSDIIYEFNK